jgi:hypothetical protein
MWYGEIEKKIELAVTKNFSWQFVKISIIYQMSVLKVRLMIFENVEILIFIKVSIMCDLSVVKEAVLSPEVGIRSF